MGESTEEQESQPFLVRILHRSVLCSADGILQGNAGTSISASAQLGALKADLQRGLSAKQLQEVREGQMDLTQIEDEIWHYQQKIEQLRGMIRECEKSVVAVEGESRTKREQIILLKEKQVQFLVQVGRMV